MQPERVIIAGGGIGGMALAAAVVLARAIARGEAPEGAFAYYYRKRSRRTARIMRMSRWWGKSGLWKSAAAVWMRDLAYRTTPEWLFESGMRDQYGYDVGKLSGEESDER